MKVLERKLDKSRTKANYKNVVWFYDFWSCLTESRSAKYVLKFAKIKDKETHNVIIFWIVAAKLNNHEYK